MTQNENEAADDVIYGEDVHTFRYYACMKICGLLSSVIFAVIGSSHLCDA